MESKLTEIAELKAQATRITPAYREPHINRRNFGKLMLAALVSAGCNEEKAATEKAATEKPAAKRHNPINPNKTVTEDQEKKENPALPKVEFKPNVWLAKPNFPAGLEFKSLCESIKNKFESHLRKRLEQRPKAKATIPNDEAFNAFIRKLLIEIHPDFAEVFQTMDFSDRYAYINYLNSFLIHAGVFLYANLSPAPDRAREANLYDVDEYGEVSFNGKAEGFYVSLRNPRLSERVKKLGMTIRPQSTSYMFSEVIDKPGKRQIRALEGDQAKIAEYIAARPLATRYHEAAHIYLNSRFPKSEKNREIECDESIRVKDWIPPMHIKRKVNYRELQELYAVGIEMNTATSPTIILNILFKTTLPQYQLARSLINLYLIQLIPDQDLKQMLKSEGQMAGIDQKAFERYMLNNPNSLTLLKEAGQKMCELAFRLLESANK